MNKFLFEKALELASENSDFTIFVKDTWFKAQKKNIFLFDEPSNTKDSTYVFLKNIHAKTETQHNTYFYLKDVVAITNEDFASKIRNLDEEHEECVLGVVSDE